MNTENNTSKRVIVGCEESQAVCIAFRKAGHEAFSCDLQDCSGGHPEWHIKSDVLTVLGDGWDMGIFHPVCRRLTNAGVRWLHKPPKGKTLDEMWEELYQGVDFYQALREAPIGRKAIENPVMHPYASDLLCNPRREIVQPWWFGDEAFKATGFELFNLPPLVATNKLTPPKPGTEEHKKWSFIHRMAPGPDREKLRSKTFPGIADAMADQWGALT